MNNTEIPNAYFEWLCNSVCGERYSAQISYRKLLMHLHNTEFVYHIPKDRNRAVDGIGLRYRFAKYYDIDKVNYVTGCLEGPCSVLEMMVALAMRCEETIMDDPQIGDRTGEWFWDMITSLGLGSMNDNRYDKKDVSDIISRFLNREYEPDGRGGLFTVRHCDVDLRDVEIFYQLCYFLDTIT